jgi:16S rRNA (uracil1498-N3)-methyltransferase
MKLHRFYTGNIKDKSGRLELSGEIWVHDKDLLNQWLYVLRFKVGDELILFNEESEKLYEITKIESFISVGLKLKTSEYRQLPSKHVYLMWSLLKNDKNDFIVQKATELGVRNFVPLITDRSQKLDFNIERARKISIEASEQCGRADIADIREPVTLMEALAEYKDITMIICEKTNAIIKDIENINKIALFIGPEGGWSASEMALFESRQLLHLNISDFTLRSETAAIVAAAKLLQ